MVIYKNILSCKNLYNLVNCLYSYETLERKANGDISDGCLYDIANFLESCIYKDNRNTIDWKKALREDLNLYKFFLENDKLCFIYFGKFNIYDYKEASKYKKYIDKFFIKKDHFEFCPNKIENLFLRKKIIGLSIMTLYHILLNKNFSNYDELQDRYLLHLVQINHARKGLVTLKEYTTLFDDKTEFDIYNPFRQKYLFNRRNFIPFVIDYINFLKYLKFMINRGKRINMYTFILYVTYNINLHNTVNGRERNIKNLVERVFLDYKNPLSDYERKIYLSKKIDNLYDYYEYCTHWERFSYKKILDFFSFLKEYKRCFKLINKSFKQVNIDKLEQVRKLNDFYDFYIKIDKSIKEKLFKEILV